MKRSFFVSIALFMSLFCFTQDLDPQIYDQYLGTYTSANGKEYVIGRSFVRLYLFDPQTSEYRGLYAENDSLWYSVNSVLKQDSSQTEKKITFHQDKGKISRISIQENGRTTVAHRSPKYSEQVVSFKNGAVTLEGTLLLPKGKNKVPAVVLVHGSGEQNRHGYASYMRIIADHLARNGIAVLSFDKRGCGQSTGQWQTASFTDLASDAIQGAKWLKNIPQIDQDQIGFGGSSQAGWILGKLTSLQPNAPFIFCISGAGMGISAAKQNLYNTETELRARNLAEKDVQAALQAWNYLYEYIANGKKQIARKLDATLDQIQPEGETIYFLPAKSTTFSLDSKDNWFQALEVNYDPVQDWQQYRGHVLALFGELDASTPVDAVMEALQPALNRGANTSHQVKIYPKASHLILRASIKSDAEFGRLKAFEPLFLPEISNWILRVSEKENPAITQVKNVERAWLDTYEQTDKEKMAEVVHDQFEITFPNGTIQSKSQILADLENYPASCPQMRIYTTQSRAEHFGDIVILRGVVTTECQLADGPYYDRQRYTDTYQKIDGTWQVIASHLSTYD